MKDFIQKRAVLVVLSAALSSLGTVFAVAQPALYQAFCGV